MKQKTKLTPICLASAVVAASIASSFSGHAQGAIASLSDVAVSGGYDYTIILQNTGSTDLNGFWYGWTDNGNNLPTQPDSSSLGSSLGWDGVLSGNSIQWQNNSGSALSSGDSGTFTFFSTDTPNAITAPPSGESVAYVDTIQFNQDMDGVSTPVFSPALVATPEPSPAALLGLGSLGFLAIRKMVRRRGSSAT
jgi:hypothetical protein